MGGGERCGTGDRRGGAGAQRGTGQVDGMEEIVRRGGAAWEMV